MNAKRAGVKDPSQYWHLIYSWSAQSRDEAPFNKSIKCGELIFWMAESSGAVSKDRLNELCDQILAGDVRDRFPLTQHPKYPLTADADKRNWFDIEKFLDHNLILKPDDQYEVIEINED